MNHKKVPKIWSDQHLFVTGTKCTEWFPPLLRPSMCNGPKDQVVGFLFCSSQNEGRCPKEHHLCPWNFTVVKLRYCWGYFMSCSPKQLGTATPQRKETMPKYKHSTISWGLLPQRVCYLQTSDQLHPMPWAWKERVYSVPQASSTVEAWGFPAFTLQCRLSSSLWTVLLHVAWCGCVRGTDCRPTHGPVPEENQVQDTFLRQELCSVVSSHLQTCSGSGNVLFGFPQTNYLYLPLPLLLPTFSSQTSEFWLFIQIQRISVLHCVLIFSIRAILGSNIALLDELNLTVTLLASPVLTMVIFT